MTPANNDGASSVATATPSSNHDIAPTITNNSHSDENLTQIAWSLIQQLQDDFVAQEKKTCRDCLRSKTLPCSRVVEVANGELFSSKNASISPTQILTKAHQLLVDQATKFGALTNYDPQITPSSLDCMKTISGALRFLQLVLLLSERQSSQQTDFPSEANINTMMVSLLKAWTHGVCELTRACAQLHPSDDERDDCMALDATQNLHAGPIFCYAFYSLLRMNEYVQTRGALMVPLWKGLCELAKLLVPSDTQMEDQDWRNSLPPNILGDAILVLGDFLQEGKGRLEVEALQYCNTEPTPTARIAFQGKFVGFIMARMGQLLQIHCSKTGNNKSADAIPNSVWRSLLGMRGMAATLQLLSSSGSLQRQSLEPSFLKVYCEIAAKAGKCVMDTILPKQEQTRQVLLPALESFLQSTMVTQGVEFASDDEYHPHQEYQTETKSMLIRISGLARTLGKVSALQQFLEICSHEIDSFENIQALVAAVEHMHFVAVRQCLSACLIAVRSETKSNNSTPTMIVLGSLRVMVRSLRDIETSPQFKASPKRDAFYRLLIRWLAGNSEKGDSSVDSGLQEHPLSRELVISLLHAHIVGCSEESEKLLSLLATLLFDARTQLSLRRNIAAVLVRVVQGSDSKQANRAACAMATERIHTEFVSWLKSSARSAKKRKRSGKSTSPRLQQEDILVIARVLGTKRGLSESAFASFVPTDCQQVLFNEFNRLSSDCRKDAPENAECLLESADKTTLLLAWLEGTIATSPTSCVPSMLQMTGLDLVVDVLRPFLSVVSGPRFRLGNDCDRTNVLQRKVMLYSASMRLFAAWSIAFGDEGQLPIEKACLLIKHSISKDPWQQPEAKDRPSIDKQHSILKFEVLNLLGCIAKAVPRNCPEKVLKTIRRAFCFFLSSNDWSIVSSGISSVVQFGSDLNAAHQGMLPLCLPPSSMGVFQARASGQNSHSHTETSFEIVEDLQRLRCSSSTRSLQAMLAGTTTTLVVPGSYILEMPTQENRTATVIFPPGDQSLQDIRYMLGEDTQIFTQTLKRAVVTANGAFQLLLVPSPS